MTAQPRGEAKRTGVPPLVITQDNEFFFAQAAQGKLAIQRCDPCGELRHPPAPTCASCLSFEWDFILVSGEATLHSYAVSHYPQDPAFAYPLITALADLPEGVRIVADMVGVEIEELEIDMPLVVQFSTHAHGNLLPQLTSRKAATGVCAETTSEEIAV